MVHFVLGSAFVLLAAAMFDFGLNRWVTWLGATAAAMFGGTFLLQGVADLTEIAALHWLAFDVLGQQLERILPDVVYIWFAALLLTGSTGFSRLVGWVVVPTAVRPGAARSSSAPRSGSMSRSSGLTIFAPFIWLLSSRQAPGVADGCYVAPARASRGGRIRLTPSPADGRLRSSAAAVPAQAGPRPFPVRTTATRPRGRRRRQVA